MQFVKGTPFSEAVGKLGSKSIVGSRLSSSEWGDVPVGLRERAFFSSRIENARFLQRARDAIAEYLQGARDETTALKMGSRAEFVSVMREFALKEGMGPVSEEGAGGLTDITSERRLGLIFDVQTRQAGDYGYWRQGMDAGVLNEFPAQRFIRVQKVKQERDSHRRFENQVYLKTDPIWKLEINEDFGVPWGPWAWGCGHDVEDVDREEAEGLGLVKRGERVAPAVQDFNENLRASAKGLDGDLVAILRAEFRGKAILDGEEWQWTKF